MGRPSKFTADRKKRIIEAKRVGASNKTAALVAGIGEPTLRDWLERGRKGPKDSAYAKFLEEFEQAAAHPRERALGIIYNALPDRPDLAWKYIERREEGYAPPIAQPAAVVQPVAITLSFFEAPAPARNEVSVVATDRPASTPELESGSGAPSGSA